MITPTRENPRAGQEPFADGRMEIIQQGGKEYVLHKRGASYSLRGSAAEARYRHSDKGLKAYVLLGRRYEIYRKGRASRDVMYDLEARFPCGSAACEFQGCDAAAWVATRRTARRAAAAARAAPPAPAPAPGQTMVLH